MGNGIKVMKEKNVKTEGNIGHAFIYNFVTLTMKSMYFKIMGNAAKYPQNKQGNY